ERVEVACGGGKGRTGTALACVAVLDGVPADEAVSYVRAHYTPRAVETPWQRRYVRRFAPFSPAPQPDGD
ncbi:protein-tyrosine phosphatase family protein, partial [Streptomyces albus]